MGRSTPTRERARDTYLAGIFNEEERAAFLQWNTKAWNLYSQLHASHEAGTPLSPELDALMHISFAEFIARDGLPHKVSEWIRVTLEPEIAIEWDKISALDGLDEMRLFLDSPEGFGEKNYHVLGGNTLFTEGLTAHLRPGQLMTQARVTAIEQTDSGVKVRVLQDDRQFLDITGRMVVVTVPVNVLGRIQFSPALSREKWQAIQTTRMGSYVKVHFRVAPEASPLWEVNGENVLTLLSDSPAGSIYDVTEIQEGDQDPRDRVLTLLLHARFAREIMNLPVDEMREKSAEALDNLFPGIRQHIRSAEIFAYPQAVAYWPWSSDAPASMRSRPSCAVPRAVSTSEATRRRTATRKGPSSPGCGSRGRSSSAGASCGCTWILPGPPRGRREQGSSARGNSRLQRPRGPAVPRSTRTHHPSFAGGEHSRRLLNGRPLTQASGRTHAIPTIKLKYRAAQEARTAFHRAGRNDSHDRLLF
ncbi:FAD-dependent oxidoreductase [Cystobacter fuscus]